ncbi:MAG: rRNA maturation RNase YbeY [Bacteroidales bacterium]|jgi:rRNA maturation RNase YbeY|nr:rRNA maturation RNase YbeY [Bacteroidales bacterium]
MADKPKIYFFLEEVNCYLKHKRKIREWIIKSAENEDFTVGVLNYILTNDNILVQLNKEYLHHFTLTDIITFDMSENEGEISGDIYISIDRARENAKEYRVSLNNEINRLMIHGILHLMGYKDKTNEEREMMRSKEEFYLSLPPWS